MAGWTDFYKNAECVYEVIFSWWREASRAESLNTPPLAESKTGDFTDWRTLAKGDSWKRAAAEWKQLTGLPALHRFDGQGWYVALLAAGMPVTWEQLPPNAERIERVKAWATVKLGERPKRADSPDLTPVQDAIYRVLTNEYQSAVAIADAARCDRDNCRRELANLKRFELADHKPRIGYRRASARAV